jgi:hypothetical protein
MRPIIVNGKPHKVIQETAKQARKVVPSLAKSTGGLGMITKLCLILLVIAGCYGFVRLYSPRRSSVAGRHGAYESKAYP